MNPRYTKKVITKLSYSFTENKNFELTKRLKEKNLAITFDLCRNLDLLLALVIYKDEFTFDYIHLVDQ